MILGSMRASARWLLLLSLALPNLACGSDQDRVDAHLAEAQTLRAQGELREAEIEIRSALKLRPQDAGVNLELARVLEDRLEFRDAHFYYQEAFRLDPEQIEAGLAAARITIGEDTAASKEIVEGILERRPGSALAHVSRSSVALVEEDVDTALASALTATEIDASEPEAWLALGRVHQARVRQARLAGDEIDESAFGDALAAFERGVELEGPAGLNAFERVRTIAITPGRIEEAGPLYIALLDALPAEDKGFRANVGESLIEYGNRRDAPELLRRGLREVIAFDPANLRPWQEWERLEERLERGGGDAVYQELLKERPDDPYVHDLYARYLIMRNRIDAAKSHLRDAIASLGDRAALPMYRLVELHQAFDEMDDANAVLTDMEARFPDHPFLDAAYAQGLMKEGRWEQARELLRRLTTRAVDPEFYRLLATCEFRLRNSPGAEDALDRAQELLGGFDQEIQRLRARNRFQARDWARTVRTYRSIAQRGYPLTAGERTLLAISHYRLGRREVGRKILEELIQGPAPPIRAIQTYALREGADHPEEAMRAVEKGFELYPGSGQLHRVRARLDLQAGRHEEALARLDALVEAGDTTPALRLLRGQVRRIQGDTEGAIEDARYVLEAAPENRPARTLLVQVYATAGRLDELLADLEASRTRGELSVRDKLVLGQLLVRRDRGDEALEVYEEVLRERPDLAAAKGPLARLLAERNRDLDRALELAQESVASAPQNPEAADTLGFVFLRRGLAEPALSQFDAALSLAGEDGGAAYHYHRGLALAALGRTEEAGDAIKVAKVADPELEIVLPEGVSIE